MKQKNQTAILALLGTISYSQAIKLSPSELPTMYGDPEYADTWRWTNDKRYVNGTQWEEDEPAGYDSFAATEADIRSTLEVPDYWSWDYSGEKHWKFANDKFYADPQEWIDSSPKGYDDYVYDTSMGQVEANNIPGVTFVPGKKQQLTQAEAKTEVPDYWSWDYSGNKHWKFANDKFYADPEEWIDSAPAAYDVEPYSSFAQQERKPYPGVTFVDQKSQGLAQVERSHKWDNKIPNPSAWTDEHYDSSNEEDYNSDSPHGYPHPNFVQHRRAHGGHKGHKHGHHQQQEAAPVHQLSRSHHLSEKHHHKSHHQQEQVQHHHRGSNPHMSHHARQSHQQQPVMPRNFIYPVNTHSTIEPYIIKDYAWNDKQFNLMNPTEYDEDRPVGYYYDD